MTQEDSDSKILQVKTMLYYNLTMKCATKSILQKTLGKRFWKINLTYKSKIKHSKATHFCIVYASTHILTYPILGTT